MKTETKELDNDWYIIFVENLLKLCRGQFTVLFSLAMIFSLAIFLAYNVRIQDWFDGATLSKQQSNLVLDLIGVILDVDMVSVNLDSNDQN